MAYRYGILLRKNHIVILQEDCILFHRMDFIARKRQFRQRLSDRLYCIVGIVIMYMQKIVRIMQEKLQLSRD